MRIEDIELFEVNEAFAAVPMTFMKHFDVSHDVVNVNGGAIALGHPLGATGAMLLGTLLSTPWRIATSPPASSPCVLAAAWATTIVERV